MKVNKFPLYGKVGIIFVVLFWALNWLLTGLRTHLLFFPLWLGFILVINGLVQLRKGSSLLSRYKFRFLFLFLFSTPAWWLFEFFNSHTLNWIYQGREHFTDFQYFLLASLSFSTVMPAVFSSAELASTFKWINNFKSGWRLNNTSIILYIMLGSGFLTLGLILIFPQVFYPLIWITVFLLLEPFNVFLGNRNVFEKISKGDWRQILALICGCLICAFFWELWNYYSYPKWIYNLPMVNTFHIFEMPLPGYIGYIPFSLELFSLFNFLSGIFGRKGLNIPD